jgi:PAS domain S-box-containing protein
MPQATKPPVLSEREKEVLFLAADGLTDKEIAQRLNIGTKTVRTYWDRMRTKLQAASRTQALAIALRSAYDELAASEERLRRFLDVMPVMFFAFDENYQILMLNEEAKQVLGDDHSEVTNHKDLFERMFPVPDERERMFAEWQRRQGNFRDWLARVNHADGGLRASAWASTSKTNPVPGWHSWVVGVDLKECFAAAPALEESLSAVALSESVGVWLLDCGSRSLFANEKMANLVGTRIDDLLVRSPADFLHPEDEAEVAEILHAGQPRLVPLTLRRGDDSAILTWASFCPIRNRDGSVGWHLLTVTPH